LFLLLLALWYSLSWGVSWNSASQIQWTCLWVIQILHYWYLSVTKESD
jgi:hypothetical protein